MIPEDPSGLNWAEGLVITSIDSMLSAGICCRIAPRLAADIMVEGLPSISTWTLVSPRRERLPSTSTSTEGRLHSTSSTGPDVACRSCATE